MTHTRSRPLAIALFAVLFSLSFAPLAAASPQSLTLTRIDAARLYVSPGEVVTVQMTLRNTAAVEDTFVLTVAGDRHYAFSSAGAPVTLAAGESTIVSYTVTAAAAWYYGDFRLTATSQNDSAVYKYVDTGIETPVVLTVTMNDSRISPTGQNVTGRVSAVHLDGSPFVGARVSVAAQGSVAGVRTPGSSGSLTTGADGKAYFNFGQLNPLDRTPGRHFVHAGVLRPGATETPSANEAFYNVLL